MSEKELGRVGINVFLHFFQVPKWSKKYIVFSTFGAKTVVSSILKIFITNLKKNLRVGGVLLE